jgi:lysophospholipase L1-like esterase
VARHIFSAGTVTNTTGAPLRLTFHATSTTTRRETDLWTVDGSNNLSAPVPNGIILTDSSGAYGAFAGPEDLTSLYLVAHNGSSRTAITASEFVVGNGAATIPVPHLYYPRGLRRWRLALADARTTPAVITCYGDSITQGNNADNSAGGASSSVLGNYRTRGWPAQLRAMFAGSLGITDPGEGAILLDNSGQETRLAFTSASASQTIAPHQYGYSMTSTGKIDLTVSGAVEVRVTIWNPNSGGGAITYGWDSDTNPGTAVTTGSADTFTATTIATPDTGSHTLHLWGPASGTGYASRVDAFAVAAADRTGVIVNRFGKPGQNTSAGFGSDFFTGTNQQRIMRATFDSTATNLAVFMFGANDYWYQPHGHTTSHNVTPTVFASNLQFGIDCVTNQNGKTTMTTPGCVLLVAGPRRPTWDLAAAPTYTEQQYYDAMKAVAAANDHVAFLDLSESWGSQSSAHTAGLCASSDVHPYRVGHGDIARILQGALTSREITTV